MHGLHHLPLPEASIDVDVDVAAFCLYHSPHPEHVVAEIARCLAPGGRAVLVTKSADSYHEIDQLIADAGLDPRADNRPSLYESAPAIRRRVPNRTDRDSRSFDQHRAVRVLKR